MTAPRMQADVECLFGPFDGSHVPLAGPKLIVAQFEKSAVLYCYELRREDDGSYFYEFTGSYEREQVSP